MMEQTPGGHAPGQAAAPLALVTDPHYLLHETGAHVETPARLHAIAAYLEATGIAARVPRITPRAATDDDLLAVHAATHLAEIWAIHERGGGRIDLDTVMSAHSESVARLAAGGLLAAIDAVVGGEARSAMVLSRPPGHHAMVARTMGFCLYNSIAVAARYAQRRHGLERILILDWDVHHGNGTQDIFDADPSVLFLSLHQYPLWPQGWGWLDQTGSGPGRGRTVNIPLPPGEGDAGYLLACDEIIRPIATAFRPHLVLVSAGQDSHAADPIGSMNLSASGFAAMTRLAQDIAAAAGAYGPVLLLEGGYNPDTLPYLVGAILDVLGGLGLAVDDPYHVDVAVTTEARWRIDMVRGIQREWWKI